MPITTISSFPITAEAFLNHWNQVNAALGAPANALTLTGGYAVANLAADRTAVLNSFAAVINAENGVTNAAADRDMKRNALRLRLTQFRGIVTSLLADSAYARACPKLPQTTAGEGAYRRAFEEVAALWTRINAAPPPGFAAPLTLAGGYALATFSAEFAALTAAYDAAHRAAQNAALAREARDLLLPPLRARLRQYRGAVIGKLPPDSPLLNALPAYSRPDHRIRFRVSPAAPPA